MKNLIKPNADHEPPEGENFYREVSIHLTKRTYEKSTSFMSQEFTFRKRQIIHQNKVTHGVILNIGDSSSNT